MNSGINSFIRAIRDPYALNTTQVGFNYEMFATRITREPRKITAEQLTVYPPLRTPAFSAVINHLIFGSVPYTVTWINNH